MNGCFLKLVLAVFLFTTLLQRANCQETRQRSESKTVDFDITTIANFNERILLIHDLLNDCRFQTIQNENDGHFIISTGAEAPDGFDLQALFASFLDENAKHFAQMDKNEASEQAMAHKAMLPSDVVASLMMDIYTRSRQNNLCAYADPFCTDNGLYQFPAGVNAGNGENGPDYDCLMTKPNPAWYYMRIASPGGINIYMYSTPAEDIDFCCWGPFENPEEACTSLTESKVVSCSYSPNETETCQIPNSAQTGQYYIMVITNYSNHVCDISFSKNSGNGTTDCSILPPLVNNDGPYCIGDVIHLTGNAQLGASYHWTGPNGFSSNLQNPTIANCNLSHTGTYTCTITVGNQTSNATTEVRVYARPTASFTATSVCLGNSTQFTSTSTTNPPGENMTYSWNFGDGQTSRQPNPSHQYAAAGTYTVSLTVNCGGACPNTKTQTVTVYAMPSANAGEDQTIDYSADTQLHGTGGIGNFNYRWEPADKVVNPNAAQTRTINLTESTTFTLTVTNPQGGCTSSDQMNVLVNGPAMSATVGATPSSVCQGSPTQLNATVTGGTGNYTYSWTPTTGLGNPTSPNPIAYPNETTTYTCVISDGQTTQTLTTTVTVNMPVEEEQEAYICPDEEVDFYGETYSSEGDYVYQTLTAQGCEKTITLHLHHYPTYENAHTTQAAICGGTTYEFHGQYYNNTGLYPKTLQTIHGCDSVVWLDLTVYPVNDTVFVEPEICVNQSYNFHGTEYSTDGAIAYFDTIDSHGCPKVEMLRLKVGEYQTPPVEEQYICYSPGEPHSFYWDKTGQTYTHDTYEEIILPDPNGDCDFKYRLDLKFHEMFINEQSITACDEYVWPVTGERFTATNHHIERSFPHQVGSNFVCDSTFILDLTINHSNQTTLNVNNQCDQYEWHFGWNDESYTYTESGEYTKTIETALGCDSIVTLRLNLNYTPDFPQVKGKSWVVGGSEFQYTIEKYWVDTDPRAAHTTRWHFGNPDFNQWQIVPFGLNQDSCLLYIFTFERDSIELCATTQGPCGQFTHSRWIRCGYHDVEENSTGRHVEVFPNPNDGRFTIAFDNMMGDVHVNILDMRGMVVDQLLIAVGSEHQAYRYDATALAPGIYIVSITNKEGTITKKMVLMK